MHVRRDVDFDPSKGCADFADWGDPFWTEPCANAPSKDGLPMHLLDSSALQLDLKGFEGDRVVPYVVQLDFESLVMVRQCVRSTNGAARTLV